MVKRRKIPVRHHHGIRDPLKQQEEREKQLKHITNNPPEKDGQKLSRTFMQFKKLADAAKSGKLPKRFSAGQEDVPKPQKAGKGKKTSTQSDSSKKLKFVKPLPGEEDRAYLKRVNRITSESLREAQYEAKYGVRVVRNSKTGEIKIEKKPKNEIDELLKQKKKERLLAKQGKHQRNKKQKVEEEKMDPKTAKELIKQAQREAKTEKGKETPQEYQREHFKFGEVVHAPPTLKTLPRKAQKPDTVPRPGMKKNLLLQTLMKENTKSKNTEAAPKKKKIASSSAGITKAQLKGKRKELPAATRDMLEKERTKFVELYRNIKKAKESAITA